MVDILLVNPNNRIVSPFAGIEPPLWLGLIAGGYLKLGANIQILDAEALDISSKETAEEIEEINPDKVIIVVMGNNPSVSSTPKMIATKKIIDKLTTRMKNRTKVTGLHPLALPKETEEELGVPVLDGQAFTEMPFMPWHLLPMDRYRAHNWHCLDGSPRSPYASIYTSLGCPFSCNFCNIHALYGGQHKVWYREPADVIEEINILENKYQVRNIKFWDELFTLSPSHVEDICDRLIFSDHDLNIWAYAKVDTVNADLLYKMSLAGIKWLAYGFESGSDKGLKEINKKANKTEAVEAVKLTHEAGINIIGNFLFGTEHDEETLEFAKRLGLEYVNFYTVKAYPGSDIYKGNNDWASYNQYGENSQEFADRAFIDFFSDSKYLDSIRVKFGKQAVLHIKEMLKFGKPTTRSD